MRRDVGGERREARRQRIHEGARHGLHERRRGALSERRRAPPAGTVSISPDLSDCAGAPRRARLHARGAGLGERLGAVGLHAQDQRAAGGVGVGDGAADRARDARRRRQLDPAGQQVDAGAHVVAQVGGEHRAAVGAEGDADATGEFDAQQARPAPVTSRSPACSRTPSASAKRAPSRSRRASPSSIVTTGARGAAAAAARAQVARTAARKVRKRNGSIPRLWPPRATARRDLSTRARLLARGYAPLPALPLKRRRPNSRERPIRLCRSARGQPLGGRERQRPWGGQSWSGRSGSAGRLAASPSGAGSASDRGAVNFGCIRRSIRP